MTAAYADARPASIAHRSQGRCTIRNALVCISVASALITPGYATRLDEHLPVYVMAVAELFLILLAATEVHHRARIASDGDWQPLLDGIRADRVVDYGIGLDMFMRDARSATYREQAAAVEVRHGDPIRTHAVLARSLRGHALAAAGVAVAIAATVIH